VSHGLTHAVVAHTDNVLHFGSLVLDRPTLVSLGIQVVITGDDNYNATVTVRYRKSGTTTWRSGLPLYRVHPESIPCFVDPQFDGSIFDLRPNTTYEIELHATDPDGPVDQTLTITGTTRAIPGDPPTPHIVNVANAAELQGALNRAQPGDMITIANGVYSGPFSMTASGAPTNPIVIDGGARTPTIAASSCAVTAW
jgi:hypothetical protein